MRGIFPLVEQIHELANQYVDLIAIKMRHIFSEECGMTYDLPACL
jgi:hypothetical protein